MNCSPLLNWLAAKPLISPVIPPPIANKQSCLEKFFSSKTLRILFVVFKFLFFSFGICGLFVSVDVIIQYFVGKDLFGYEASGRRLSGPFDDEYIAGSYIQRFFIFLPIALTFYAIREKNFL